MDNEYKNNSFKIVNDLVSKSERQILQNQLLKIANNLGADFNFDDVDKMWNYFKKENRKLGGAVYNGFKYLPIINKIAHSENMHKNLKKVCGIDNPALVDVNCRIDSSGEEKFLFDWHQDYWFSVSSTKAVVVWMPISGLNPSIGGLEIISSHQKNIKTYKTKQGTKYDSYADAFLIDDVIPYEDVKIIDQMDAGSALFFSFSSLHKSLPVLSKDKSRFTIQFRFADFDDKEFINNHYRPGQVTKESVVKSETK